MAIIGHTLDQPIARYKATCAALSKTYHLPPFVSFVTAANLKNGDFYDLWHSRRAGAPSGRRCSRNDRLADEEVQTGW